MSQITLTRPTPSTAARRSRRPSTYVAGTTLVVAAAIYFVAWVLVPVAGVTDPQAIFDLVSPHRGALLTSVILQLICMTLYIPAMVGLIRNTRLPYHAKVWIPCTVLAIGTLGDVADAMDHMLAYAM